MPTFGKQRYSYSQLSFLMTLASKKASLIPLRK
ncbi:hypothetical protein CMALT394_770012 [Carnobacterium maltaromaticum]|nr:hypothetical protein CMALT394_770012 [Carnobacterium maltaromaticum]